MSQEFMKRVEEYVINRKVIELIYSNSQYDMGLKLMEIDPTGVLDYVSCEKDNMTQRELEIMEIFANKEIYDTFCKHEVYG